MIVNEKDILKSIEKYIVNVRVNALPENAKFQEVTIIKKEDFKSGAMCFWNYFFENNMELLDLIVKSINKRHQNVKVFQLFNKSNVIKKEMNLNEDDCTQKYKINFTIDASLKNELISFLKKSFVWRDENHNKVIPKSQSIKELSKYSLKFEFCNGINEFNDYALKKSIEYANNDRSKFESFYLGFYDFFIETYFITDDVIIEKNRTINSHILYNPRFTQMKHPLLGFKTMDFFNEKIFDFTKTTDLILFLEILENNQYISAPFNEIIQKYFDSLDDNSINGDYNLIEKSITIDFLYNKIDRFFDQRAKLKKLYSLICKYDLEKVFFNDNYSALKSIFLIDKKIIEKEIPYSVEKREEETYIVVDFSYLMQTYGFCVSTTMESENGFQSEKIELTQKKVRFPFVFKSQIENPSTQEIEYQVQGFVYACMLKDSGELNGSSLEEIIRKHYLEKELKKDKVGSENPKPIKKI